MTDLRKAAKDALLILDNIRVYEMRLDLIEKHPEVKEALRQALAQPQPEQINEVQFWKDRFENANTQLEQCMARTRTLVGMIGKKQWQNLTDDEIKEIVGPWGDTPIKGYTRKLFDQIEAKLKEKNT